MEPNNKDHQFPNLFLKCEQGYATVKTFVGEQQYGITNRVSPRISEHTKNEVLTAMSEQVKTGVFEKHPELREQVAA